MGKKTVLMDKRTVLMSERTVLMNKRTVLSPFQTVLIASETVRSVLRALRWLPGTVRKALQSVCLRFGGVRSSYGTVPLARQAVSQ